MKYLKKLSLGFFREEDGVTTTEYAIMVALVIVVCLGTIGLLGDSLNDTFIFISNSM